MWILCPSSDNGEALPARRVLIVLEREQLGMVRQPVVIKGQKIIHTTSKRLAKKKNGLLIMTLSTVMKLDFSGRKCPGEDTLLRQENAKPPTYAGQLLCVHVNGNLKIKPFLLVYHSTPKVLTKQTNKKHEDFISISEMADRTYMEI